MLDSDFKLPVKEVIIPVKDVVSSVGGQDYMWRLTPQCPKHWHLLETKRGSEPYTIVIGACDACAKEQE